MAGNVTELVATQSPASQAWSSKAHHSQSQAHCLRQAHSSSDWEAEMAKVFEQTTAALQDIISEDGQQGSSCLRLLETGNTAESQPDAAGEGQNHADHRGRSNIQPLHGLTERPPFQRISDIDPEQSEAVLLHWVNAATASAKVSLPGVRLKGQGPAERDAVVEAFDKQSPCPQGPITTAEPSHPVLASAMVPVLPSDPHIDLPPLRPSPGGSGMLPAFYQGCTMLCPSSEAWLAAADVPSAGTCRSRSLSTSAAADLCAPDLSPIDSLLTDAARELASQAARQRQSKRVHKAPKWQDAYSADDTSSQSPAVDRSGRRREGPSHSGAKRAGRKRLQVDHITLDMLQEHGLFDMPIQAAARELGVGLSVLKRICRQIGLKRWPFRTRQSLRGVIAKTEQYLAVDDKEGAQKSEVVQALQETLHSLQGEAGQGLSESVRKYRQSVFKLNYKIKKNAARPKMAGCSPAILATAAARVAAASAALKAEEASPGQPERYIRPGSPRSALMDAKQPAAFSTARAADVADLDGPLMDPLCLLEEALAMQLE